MNCSLDLVLDGPDGNAEHALSPSENVHDLFFRMGRVDGLAITEECDVSQRLVGVELLPEDVHGRADLLEAHTGIEEALDDLELDDVSE